MNGRNITRHTDAMGTERKKKGGAPSPPPPLPGKRESPKSTSNGYLSLFLSSLPSPLPLPSPAATCLGVKKAEGATEEEAEDHEIVGKRAIRFHYPSHRGSNFDAARNAQIYINLSGLSLAVLSCEARKEKRRREERGRRVGEGWGGEGGVVHRAADFFLSASVTLISSFARASFINELGNIRSPGPGCRHNQGIISLV